MPIPIRTGPETARTKPMISAAAIAPGKEPIVPRTMTAKEGSRRENAVIGLKSRVIPKIPPPIPDIPADRNALVMWTFSTLIPLLAASSGLSATALILRPRRVRVRIASRMNTVAKLTIGKNALLYA